MNDKRVSMFNDRVSGNISDVFLRMNETSGKGYKYT